MVKRKLFISVCFILVLVIFAFFKQRQTMKCIEDYRKTYPTLSFEQEIHGKITKIITEECPQSREDPTSTAIIINDTFNCCLSTSSNSKEKYGIYLDDVLVEGLIIEKEANSRKILLREPYNSEGVRYEFELLGEY